MGVARWLIAPDLGERRVLHPGKLRWLRALAWMVVVILAVGLAFGPSLEAMLRLAEKDQGLRLAAQLLAAVIALGVYAVIVRLGEDRAPSELSLKAAPAGLLAGLGLGALMFCTVMAILVGLHLYDFKPLGPAPAWRAVGLAIQSGVFEELVIRAVIFRLCWRALGPWPALAISALLFGAGHIGNPGATLVSTLSIAVEAGVMLAALYALSGRLWLPIGLHAAWNFTQGYVFGAAVSGGDFGVGLAKSTARPGSPTWLTGGSFGPEASLPAVIVCSAVGLAALWWAWRLRRFARPAPAEEEVVVPLR